MKILFLSDLWKPFPGGAEAYFFNMAAALHNRGHQISILTSYECAIYGNPAFHLIQELDLGKRENREDRAELLLAHANVQRPDVVIIHRYFAEEYGSLVMKWGIPIVEVVHQHKKIPNAHFHVYNTEYTRRQNGAENDPKSMVILPSFSGDCYTAREKGDAIGFVKPLPCKGVDFFYELADRFPNRKFLVLRGAWQTCETIVEKPNVKFINPVEHMWEFYECCRITLMPSLSEDAGTIPCESAYNGIPCISSNVMGLPETNRGGIILPHDLNQWVEQINALDEPTYYDAVVARQRSYIASLDWSSKFDELNELLKGLL
jgi:glycosyltransferase involved in cell wall biosynthesis